jgi:Ser/Thr protein kinase RdoA (MazF antagonist)
VSTGRHPNHRELASLPPELRRTTVPPAVRDWIARATGASVVRVDRLAGASSTAVHGLTLSDGARAVLRRYVWPGFLIDEPLAPVREVDALRFAHARGLPVPEPIAADATGAAIGDGIPALLMSFVRGRAIAEPDLHALAEVAATIHSIDADALGHDYFPWYESYDLRPPASSTWPELWETADAHRRAARPPYEPRLIHRDFHPGNVLWSRGRATGVVDWANGCRGPWGCDIAHCRANLVSLSGPDAADRFLAEYEALTGRRYDWFWEMASILEHDAEWWTPARLAESEPRLARAVSEITTLPRRPSRRRDRGAARP